MPPAASQAGGEWYDLKGVLVHRGSAASGHYYSFICDRQSQQWYRFDDRNVTPFDPAHMESECFGGVSVTDSARDPWAVHDDTDIDHSAFLLFYERRVRHEPATPPAPDAADATAVSTRVAGSATGGAPSTSISHFKQFVRDRAVAAEHHVPSPFERQAWHNNEQCVGCAPHRVCVAPPQPRTCPHTHPLLLWWVRCVRVWQVHASATAVRPRVQQVLCARRGGGVCVRHAGVRSSRRPGQSRRRG